MRVRLHGQPAAEPPYADFFAWAGQQPAAARGGGELIEKYGGPLRDENEKLHQTLNKKSGGGYSIGKREVDRQNARTSLSKVWPRLKDYYDKHGNLNIPENCELENGKNGRKQKLSYEMDYIREGSSCLLQFQNHFKMQWPKFGIS